jgi:hypothetical protein
MLTEQGKLTDIGSWYLGGAATNNIPHKAAAVRAMGTAAWGFAVFAACVFALL